MQHAIIKNNQNIGKQDLAENSKVKKQPTQAQTHR